MLCDRTKDCDCRLWSLPGVWGQKGRWNMLEYSRLLSCGHHVGTMWAPCGYHVPSSSLQIPSNPFLRFSRTVVLFRKTHESPTRAQWTSKANLRFLEIFLMIFKFSQKPLCFFQFDKLDFLQQLVLQWLDIGQ